METKKLGMLTVLATVGCVGMVWFLNRYFPKKATVTPPPSVTIRTVSDTPQTYPTDVVKQVDTVMSALSSNSDPVAIAKSLHSRGLVTSYYVQQVAQNAGNWPTYAKQNRIVDAKLVSVQINKQAPVQDNQTMYFVNSTDISQYDLSNGKHSDDQQTGDWELVQYNGQWQVNDYMVSQNKSVPN